jgi:NADPH:quinone reductase-like Zn-dependent oxidoreductase
MTMHAITYTQYGSADVLKFSTVPMPTPKAGEVLVKIHAASVNSADARIMRGQPVIARLVFGLFAPKNPILGADIAGTVAAVGPGVTGLRVGDAVYGDLSNSGMGGFAEYVAAPESALAAMPANLTFEEAAAVPLAGVTALQAVHKSNVRAGECVAVNGASGGVGTYTVQIARALGAEVTAVTSAGKLALMRELGAAHAIDYAAEDFTARAGAYDVILGVNGYHPLAHYARALKPGGRYVMVGGSDAQLSEGLLRAPFTPKREGRTLTNLMAKTTAADLRDLTALIESGQVKPVIERTYTLAETADALRHLDAGHTRGKLVIRIADDRRGA